LFAELAQRAGLDRAAIRITCISQAVADAAGPGWASVRAAAQPRDEAVLELAAELCKTGGSDTGIIE
jgi:uroporphyrinogen-III synthase